MRTRFTIFLFLAATCAAQSPSPHYEVLRVSNVMVPMRDGIRLATDIYRPALNGAPVEGKFPVVLERTPYDKDKSGSLADFVQYGYIAVSQDVRGRYHSELLKPGMPYEFSIEMYPTSLVFKKGHRIRLDTSSSNFPPFDINPNTGEPLNENRRWAIADNALYHDPQHLSQIALPVIKGNRD